jgi:hypothetical protein
MQFSAWPITLFASFRAVLSLFAQCFSYVFQSVGFCSEYSFLYMSIIAASSFLNSSNCLLVIMQPRMTQSNIYIYAYSYICSRWFPCGK